MVMGSHQFVADVRLASRVELADFLFTSPWLRGATSVDTSLIIQTLKQSGILYADRE